MHGLAAARLGYSDLALRYFQQAVAIDLADTHTTIAGGLHIAALGGTWMTAVFGFAGLALQSELVALDPKLPASCRTLGFAIQWRGRRLKIRIDGANHLLQATLQAGDPMTILVSGRRHELRRDQPAVCSLDQ
jgi:trehalose/maltose hydrolase-like predicted phosphorylase